MRCFLALTAVAALVLSQVSTALANGAPVKIPLVKIPGVTNYGSPNAKGQAEITVAEGDVVVTTTGLDRLANELYQSWLVNTKTGERLSVGKFNVPADGTAQIKSVVSLGNKEYDLFAITVEPEPDPSSDADSRIVLAGYWPDRQPGAAATQTAVAGGTPVPASQPGGGVPPAATIVSTAQPRGLPHTGDFGLGGLVVGLGGLGAGLWVFGRGVRR